MIPKILFVLLGLFISYSGHAQSMTCEDLYETVSNDYDSKDETSCYNSSMLAKAEYFRMEGEGFVVAYVKEDKNDMSGFPYIFCGVSQNRWNEFKMDGIQGSWGKSFHKNIRNYPCHCD